MNNENNLFAKKLIRMWLRGVYVEALPMVACVILLIIGGRFSNVWISAAGIPCLLISVYMMIKNVYIWPIKQFFMKYAFVEPTNEDTIIFWDKVGSNITKYPKLFSDRELNLVNI